MNILPTQDELRMKSQWVHTHLTNMARSADALPFTFRYGGKRSGDLLAGWLHQRETTSLDTHRIQHTDRWNDPLTGLEIRCVALEYVDHPAVEWTVYFKNTGKTLTPILEDIQGIDTTFRWYRAIRVDQFRCRGFHPDFRQRTDGQGGDD